MPWICLMQYEGILFAVNDVDRPVYWRNTVASLQWTVYYGATDSLLSLTTYSH